jgi:ribose 5-phosphate isomerase B
LFWFEHVFKYHNFDFTSKKMHLNNYILNLYKRKKMKIAIAADHAGFKYKELIKNHLKSNFEIQDFGTFSEESVDYPDFVHPAATSVEKGENILGILICGSGEGVSITANKHQGIRCALCWEVEIAKLARQHNNANMIAIPARFISEELALQIIDAFLTTAFEGGRHQNRVAKISC